jgi:hypothetical protein
MFFKKHFGKIVILFAGITNDLIQVVIVFRNWKKSGLMKRLFSIVIQQFVPEERMLKQKVVLSETNSMN